MYSDPGFLHHLYGHYLGKTMLRGIVTMAAAGAQLTSLSSRRQHEGLKMHTC